MKHNLTKQNPHDPDALASELLRRANRAAEVVAAMEDDPDERAAIQHIDGGVPLPRTRRTAA